MWGEISLSTISGESRKMAKAKLEVVGEERAPVVKTKRDYVRWTEEQRVAVYLEMDKANTSPHSVPSLFRRKLVEAVTAAGVPPRPWGNIAIANERRHYTEWLSIIQSAKAAPPPVPVKFTVPVKAHYGLEARIATAVRQAQVETLSEVKAMLDEHAVRIETMLRQNHDSLMKYWNPEYIGFIDATKSAVDRISESVIRNLPAPQEKTKAKKILVVSNNERRLIPLEDKFRDCEFTFVNGEQRKSVDNGGTFDMVICTRFVNHHNYDKLRKMYPGKVHYANGSTSEVERVIRINLSSSLDQARRTA
jgi:hypothetical protein